MGRLTEKALKESQQLEVQYDTWQRLIQNNAPFQAWLEQARMADYFKDALRLASSGIGQ